MQDRAAQSERVSHAYGALPPPPPALDPRPNRTQATVLWILFGAGATLVVVGASLPLPHPLLWQRAGCFLATYAALIAAAWLPASVLSQRVDALIERWVRNSSGGFYGVMALSVFVQLEVVALAQRVAGIEVSAGFLREALVQRLIGFSQDSIMSFVWGMAWPGRLIQDHGAQATGLLALGAWLVFRLSRGVLPHAGLKARPKLSATR